MKRQTLFSKIRLPKAVWMAAIAAVLFGAGVGVSSAQVYDWRCQQCQWNFQACLHQCDIEGGEEGCYAGCIQQRRLCVATFCP